MDRSPTCLGCPGGTTCTQLRVASRRGLIVSGAWTLTLAGLTTAEDLPRTVLSRRRPSRTTSRLGVRGAPAADVVHHRRHAPARSASCACRFGHHDVVVALVEVTRAIVRHGGAHRVEQLFTDVLRRCDLRLDGAPSFVGEPCRSTAARPDAPILELRRFADVVAFVPERVARSRLASFLRAGLLMRTDGAVPTPWSPLERFLRELANSGVSAFDERPIDPSMRTRMAHRSTGETVWRPGREW